MTRSVLLFLSILVWSTNSPAQNTAQKGDLTGIIGIDQLLDVPGWFDQDFIDYAPNMIYVNALREHLVDVKIVAILGTWSMHSRREIPRLLRVLQLLSVDPARLTLIAVDRGLRASGIDTKAYRLEKIPTIILVRDEEERGRIVEDSGGSIEHALWQFFKPAEVEAAPPPTMEPMHPEEDSAGSVPADGRK